MFTELMVERRISISLSSALAHPILVFVAVSLSILDFCINILNGIPDMYENLDLDVVAFMVVRPLPALALLLRAVHNSRQPDLTLAVSRLCSMMADQDYCIINSLTHSQVVDSFIILLPSN